MRFPKPSSSVATPRAALVAVTLFTSGACGACNGPKEPHDATVPAAALASASASANAPTPASPPASASASAPAPAPGACTKDDDCRTFSSYCAEAPCACRTLGARDADPKCLGDAPTKVRCFADPCLKKASHCQGGTCVLTAR